MTNPITIEDINSIDAFREIKDESVLKILEMSKKIKLKKGEVLFLEKDKINHFYAILSGKISMYRLSLNGQKRVFFILGSGSLINEVVFDDLPVSVVAEAFEKSEILKINKDDFLLIMEQDFKLTMNILNSIGRKERRLYRQLKNTLPIGMEKKLAAKLWKLSKDYGVEVCLNLNNNNINNKNNQSQDNKWKHIDMNISNTYLSYMLGTTRETISRAMKALQDIDAIIWVNRKLYVREEKLLHYYRS